MKDKIKITIEFPNGMKQVIDNIDKNAIEMHLTNDLQPASTFVGRFLAARLYSRGVAFTIQGYAENPNMQEEFNEALEANMRNE